jgi:hypothetical protein
MKLRSPNGKNHRWWQAARLCLCLACSWGSGCSTAPLMKQQARKPSQEKFSCGERIPKSKLTPEEFEAATQQSRPIVPAGYGESQPGAGTGYPQPPNVQTNWAPPDAAGHGIPH